MSVLLDETPLPPPHIYSAFPALDCNAAQSDYVIFYKFYLLSFARVNEPFAVGQVDRWAHDRAREKERETETERGGGGGEGGLDFLRTSEALPTTYLSLGGRAGLVLGTVLISSSRR